jgi:hypothetical protein
MTYSSSGPTAVFTALLANGNSSAKPATGEVQHVVDQFAHAPNALAHERKCLVPRLLFQVGLREQARASINRGQGIAQIVPKNRDELVPHSVQFHSLDAIEFALCATHLGIEMETDQFGEQLEHPDDFRTACVRWPGINRLQGPEEATVLLENRHRDVTLEASQRWDGRNKPGRSRRRR